MNSNNGSTKVAEAEVVESAIHLQRLEMQTATIHIVGQTPLIAHRWSEKAKNMMLEAQTKKTRAKKEAKDPAADYEAARYRLADGRDGFPAVAFKAATVSACRDFEGITMVQAKAAMIFIGEPGVDGTQLVPIVSDPPRMREDTVRVGMGTADLRYRPEYWPWSATLTIKFKPSVLTLDSVVALVDAGGFGGVGEWRPSAPKGATGSFGTYCVEDA